MITNTSFIPLDFAYPDSPLEYAFRYDGYFKSLILNDAFAVSHIQEDLSNIIPHEVIESFIMNRDATTIVRFEAFESFNLDLYVQDDVDYTKSKYQYFYPKHFNLIHKIDYKNKQPHAELINSKTNQKYLINHDEFEKKFNEANEFPLNEGFIDQQSFQFFEEKETLCVHAEAVFYDHNLSKNRPFIFEQCLDG
ncbi:hypothetical protein [Thorsellia anophelis]|nr:hypothetical protein [Thorsellia anophelis]